MLLVYAVGCYLGSRASIGAVVSRLVGRFVPPLVGVGVARKCEPHPDKVIWHAVVEERDPALKFPAKNATSGGYSFV